MLIPTGTVSHESAADLYSRLGDNDYEVPTALTKMQASKSKKVQAIVKEFTDAGVGRRSRSGSRFP